MTTRPSSRRSRPRLGDIRLAPPVEPAPVLALSGPGELIDSIPYLLGFHPSDSLVLVGLGSSPNGRDRVGASARVDLADVAVDGAIVDRCVHALSQSGAHSAVVLIYDGEAARVGVDPASPSMPWRSVADEAAEALERADLGVRDALLVGPHRWWSYLCADPACCPLDGTERSGPDSRTAATAAYAGLSALPDRASLAAVIEPDPPEALARIAPFLEDAQRAEVAAVLADGPERSRRSIIRALFAAARSRAIDDDGAQAPAAALSDEQVARFGVALGAVAVRDACWLAFEGGRLPPSELWRTLARRLPEPYNAQALFLFGWQEWRAGRGTVASIAAERAVRSDPGCTAAELLLDLLANGLDPRSTARLRPDGRAAGRR